jgi:uncharacterized membrane protein
MDKNKLLEFFNENRGAILGSSAGFIIAIVVLFMGFFQALFLFICVGVGYYLGKRFPEDKEHIKNFLDRILPPGMYR